MHVNYILTIHHLPFSSYLGVEGQKKYGSAKLGCDRLQKRLIYQFGLPFPVTKSVPVAKRSIFLRRGQVILLEFRHWQHRSVQDGPPFLVCQHLLLEDPPFSSPKRPKTESFLDYDGRFMACMPSLDRCSWGTFWQLWQATLEPNTREHHEAPWSLIPWRAKYAASPFPTSPSGV